LVEGLEQAIMKNAMPKAIEVKRIFMESEFI
jgi:hypothetical protein